MSANRSQQMQDAPLMTHQEQMHLFLFMPAAALLLALGINTFGGVLSAVALVAVALLVVFMWPSVRSFMDPFPYGVPTAPGTTATK